MSLAEQLKEFLQLDKERLQGQWSTKGGYSEGDTVVDVEGFAVADVFGNEPQVFRTAEFLALASHIAPEIHSLLETITKQQAALKVAREGLEHYSTDDRPGDGDVARDTVKQIDEALK